jgi:hypothetical protein
MKNTPGVLELTDYGRRVANGAIAASEFVAATILGYTLPNPRTDDNAGDWTAAGLEIRPLRLILQIYRGLLDRGLSQAFMTRGELCDIVIPLAGIAASVDTHVDAIIESRNGILDPRSQGWPDCTPEANDRRSAAEFLRFLSFHDYLDRQSAPHGQNADADVYAIRQSSLPAISLLLNESIVVGGPEEMIGELRSGAGGTQAERVRRMVEQLVRPGQARFRKRILRAFANRCLITGETLSAVLEAAQNRHVKYQGSDAVNNGLCLRVDIHALFDAEHLKLSASGDLGTSEALRVSPTYLTLPARVTIPHFVDRAALDWRETYGSA